jgi:hypothetical protein
MNMSLLSITVALALLLACAGADVDAGAPSDRVPKAQKRVEDEVAKVQSGPVRIEPLTNEALERVFPKHIFVQVIFRQFPVARIVPAPYSPANIYAVADNNTLDLMSDQHALEAFLRAQTASASSDELAKDVVRAWLTLAPILLQDGFYQFSMIDESIRVSSDRSGKKASGRSVVMRGGNGEVQVEITFNSEGRVTNVRQSSKLRPGPRPICQSTKLIDRDPIVRHMAEKDLLIMGRFAKDYLKEQHQSATAELRRAIDRLLDQIDANER